MERRFVYRAIDTERDYQDDKLNEHQYLINATGEWSRTVDEFSVYIAGITDELVKECSHFGDTGMKLALMRKIAALCVACMEQHGAPIR